MKSGESDSFDNDDEEDVFAEAGIEYDELEFMDLGILSEIQREHIGKLTETHC